MLGGGDEDVGKLIGARLNRGLSGSKSVYVLQALLKILTTCNI